MIILVVTFGIYTPWRQFNRLESLDRESANAREGR